MFLLTWTEYLVLTEITKILLYCEQNTNFIIHTLHKTVIILIYRLCDTCSLKWFLVHVSASNSKQDIHIYIIFPNIHAVRFKKPETIPAAS
jgi:hypothetical protein